MIIDTIFKSSSPLLPTQSVESAVEEGPLLLVCEMASFALRSCFVLAALLMASFVCGTGAIRAKPGRCPDLKSPDIPGIKHCRSDLDCPLTLKCCPAGASARICIEPNPDLL
nr:WAP four-disulfide core domain protein 2-like [Penaeus vannamei]